ncbi:hypothetical protein NKDENANG_00043 [Candidatus Entotheonellaceae bacterium PAL068K]
MLVRMLPSDHHSMIVQELAGMGSQAPVERFKHWTPDIAVKFSDVPRASAALLISCLQQQVPACWWHQASGTSAGLVTLLVVGSSGWVTRLCQASQATPQLQPIMTALQQAGHLQAAGPAHLLLGQTAVPLWQHTQVMGILNITPDSFSDGGLYLQPEQALKHAEEMLAAGAHLIDVGGQSSRPGATPVPEVVERQRVVPVVQDIVKRYGARVSVDTYRASVAAAALDVGAVMINDISAMRFDPHMAPLIARRQAAVVLMHMQGTPRTMQQAPRYQHVVDDVYRFLAERLHHAMQHGIARQRIMLDPGFGFGKTVRHSVVLLCRLEQFTTLGQPLLVGTSRKSFLGHLLKRQVCDRLEGSLSSVIYAALHGAAMVRVHDVASVVQALQLLDSLEHGPELASVSP